MGSAVWTRIGRRSTNRRHGERCCRTNLRDRRCESCFFVIIFLDSQSYILCSIGALTNFFSFFYTQHAADRNGITRATRPVGRFLSRAKEKQRGWWRRGRGGRSLRRIYGEKFGFVPKRQRLLQISVASEFRGHRERRLSKKFGSVARGRKYRW